MIRWLAVAVMWLALAGSGRAETAPRVPTLTRGINLTNWFRFPPSRDPAMLSEYLGDPALEDLRGVGFDFVRLAVDPAIVATMAQRRVLVAAIHRIQGHGLSVVVSPHPQDWHLETTPEAIRIFWQTLAPALRDLDQARTLPEVLNEPVFAGDPAGWAMQQHVVLGDIRRALPRATIVLTGQDWGSFGVNGLNL